MRTKRLLLAASALSSTLACKDEKPLPGNPKGVFYEDAAPLPGNPKGTFYDADVAIPPPIVDAAVPDAPVDAARAPRDAAAPRDAGRAPRDARSELYTNPKGSFYDKGL